MNGGKVRLKGKGKTDKSEASRAGVKSRRLMLKNRENMIKEEQRGKSRKVKSMSLKLNF